MLNGEQTPENVKWWADWQKLFWIILASRSSDHSSKILNETDEESDGEKTTRRMEGLESLGTFSIS